MHHEVGRSEAQRKLLLRERLRELRVQRLENLLNAHIFAFRLRRRCVEPRDIEQGAEEILDAEQAIFNARHEPALFVRHLVAMLDEQRSEQLRRIKRLEQVMGRGREEACLRRISILGLGFCLAQRVHRRFELRGAIRDTLLEHFLRLDEHVLGTLEIGDVRVGRDESAIGHRLTTNLDDLAVDKTALVSVGSAFPQVFHSLGHGLFDVTVAKSPQFCVEADQILDRFANVDHAVRVIHELEVTTVSSQ